MRFGIFDHLDDSGQPLARHFEDRLKLIEAYDRAGFYGYHLAEHHNTPLGYAPSPGVFLAAVAQRTRQLRFGPMVYLLPLYHPLRLIDEICMLDQMSGGRFLYGVGRGISPVEVGFYGVDFDTDAKQFLSMPNPHGYEKKALRQRQRWWQAPPVDASPWMFASMRRVLAARNRPLVTWKMPWMM